MLFGFNFSRAPLDWANLPATLKDWFQTAGGVSAFALLLVTLAAILRSRQTTQRRGDVGPLVRSLTLLLPPATLLVWALLALRRVVLYHEAGQQLPILVLAWLITILYYIFRTQQKNQNRDDVDAPLLVFSLLFPPLALILWATLTMKRKWLDHEKTLQLPLLMLGSACTIPYYEGYGLHRLLGGEPGAWSDGFLTWGGFWAIAFTLLPMLTTLVNVRFRRIWALAQLSFKEALRSKIVLILALLALVFLFAEFFIPYKPENQVRNYVNLTFLVMLVLFMLSASVLGAFSLPNDIKNQSIHTVVTKPVEKLEIVLGRFLGFGMLLMLGLLAVSGASFLYTFQKMAPEAMDESFKARMPVYGNIHFVKNGKPDEGEHSPRPFDYRTYITGPYWGQKNPPKHYAVWEFDDLPEVLDRQEWIRFEFAFDIYRTWKGEQGENITCTFSFFDGRLPIEVAEKKLEASIQRFNKLAEGRSNISDEEKEALEKKLAEEFGCYRKVGIAVVNNHTEFIEVPGELIKVLRKRDRENPRKAPIKKIGDLPSDKEKPPFLKVMVNIENTRTGQTQLVGVAKNDFYILAAEMPFWQNYFKGVLGMGLSILLVLGIAVACSTYLSGVVSWLATLFLLLSGLSREFIKELAEGKAFGGGPMQSLQNLAENRPIGAGAIDPASVSPIVLGLDQFYQRLLGLVLNIFPDVGRFDLIEYVANGFDIPWLSILFLDNFVYLVGYLLPWLILSYYLLKFREIANPT